MILPKDGSASKERPRDLMEGPSLTVATGKDVPVGEVA